MQRNRLVTDPHPIDFPDSRFDWVVAPYTGRRIAVATPDDQIEVWDVRSRRRITHLEHAVYEGGGPRFAIDPTGQVCITAAYNSGGIGCYRVEDGAELWRRKTLRHCQTITIAPDAPVVYCGFDMKSAHMLDLKTGETLQTIQGTGAVWCSPFSMHRLFVGTSTYELMNRDHKSLGTVERSDDLIGGGSMFDVAFTPTSAILSEVTLSGTIRCISLRTRREVWRAPPPPGYYGPHNLGYCPARNIIYCVLGPKENGVGPSLAEIDPATCAIRVRSSVARDGAFCLKGTVLVTQSGDVHSTATGRTLGRLKARL